jgi:C4-dicarboxylate transporter DctM subunit
MYAGIFTATEAAAAGALLALAVGVAVYRTLRPASIWACAIDASRTSAMLFMIVAGASVFAHVVTKMRIPQQIVQVVVSMDIGIAGFLIAMMVLIFILGMFLESVAIILVTTPVILPVMATLHVDPIWYGVLLTINLELAQITPPVGMNLFTIRAISNAPLGHIIAGSFPYVLLLILGLAIVMTWPQIALWLPGTMLNLR